MRQKTLWLIVPIILTVGITLVFVANNNDVFASHEIDCADGEVTVIRVNDPKPICITEETAEKWVSYGIATIVTHSSDDAEESMEKPEVCTMDYTPVCGVDEKTYSNMCMLEGAEVGLAHEGECEIKVMEEEMMEEEVMGEEVMEDEMMEEEIKVTETSFPENSLTKPCTRDYRPVCGLDTVTYSNMCVLKSNGGIFSHHGQCVGPKKTGSVLFQNVNIFDGTSDTLQQNMNVLVEGNMITQVSKNEITVDHNTPVIEAHGMTLTPGMLDAHTHLSHMESDPLWGFENRDWMYQGATAGKDAEKMLLRGFTTVRDTGGATTGLQKAIDNGRVIGPRILSSGAYISMTSGHGDFAGLYSLSP